jgi:1D-myo-inositol-tetrakisphosphate 5-kinase/inositol-polyphosphate multikinase
MVGGSILIIYEADWERAAEGIKQYLASHSKPKADAEEEEEDEEDESDDEDHAPPPAFTVKMIDFAHTKVEAGIGPDEGVLLGVDTTLKLLGGRIATLKA